MKFYLNVFYKKPPLNKEAVFLFSGFDGAIAWGDFSTKLTTTGGQKMFSSSYDPVAIQDEELVRYYTPEEAARQLQNRVGLKSCVEDWIHRNGWGERFHIFPQIDRMAVIARHIATFRYEDAVFYTMSSKNGFKPVWLEYLDDKMVSSSPVKMSYLSPIFCSGLGRNGGYKARKKKLVPPNLWMGKALKSIKDNNSVLLSDLHHQIQDHHMVGVNRFDMSQWLSSFDRGSRDYYTPFIALCVSHMVLFEDYHGGESDETGVLSNFTKIVFEKAYKTVFDEFGVRPLIVKLPWFSGANMYPDPEAGDWREHGVVPKGYLL